MKERLSDEDARDTIIDHIMDTQGLGYEDAARQADAERDFSNGLGDRETTPERQGATLLGEKAVAGDFISPSDWKGDRVGPRRGEEEHVGYGPEGRYPDFEPLSDEQQEVNERGRAKVDVVLAEIQARIAAKKKRQ